MPVKKRFVGTLVYALPDFQNGTLVDGETTEHRNTFLTIAGIGQNPAEDIRSTILGGANLQFKQAP